MTRIKLIMKMLFFTLSVAVFSGCTTKPPENVYINEKCTVETPERLVDPNVLCTALHPPKENLTAWIDCVEIKLKLTEADYQASNVALQRCKK